MEPDHGVVQVRVWGLKAAAFSVFLSSSNIRSTFGLQGFSQAVIIPLLMRGGAVWQLVGLITRRSQVQILPPLPASAGERPLRRLFFLVARLGLCSGTGISGPLHRNPVVTDKGPVGPLVVFAFPVCVRSGLSDIEAHEPAPCKATRFPGIPCDAHGWTRQT